MVNVSTLSINQEIHLNNDTTLSKSIHYKQYTVESSPLQLEDCWQASFHEHVVKCVNYGDSNTMQVLHRKLS